MAEPKAYKAKISDFKPDQNNLNRHTQRGQRLVENSQRKRGFARPGFAAKDGTVLGGNLSVMEVATDIGMGDGEVFVVESDGDIPILHLRRDVDPDSETAALLAADDNHSALKSINYDPEVLLAEIERGIEFDGIFEADEIKEILGELGQEPKEPAEPELDKAEELRLKWGAELGQIWQIGEHRLAVGDCTDRRVVEGVMGGDRAMLVVTDPPYGVNYADKNKWLNAISFGNRIQTDIKNDHGDKEAIQAMWKAAFRETSEVMGKGAVIYCFMPQGGDQMMMMMMMMMMGAGIEPRHELIWIKNNHVLGRSDYNYKHEPILYAWKAGGHKFYGDFQTSVLEFDKPLKSDLHPTMKPVPLIAKLINNSSRSNEIVYDPFLGSGTTMVAAHQLSRRCYGIEISPAYAAVCLQRISDYAGIEPVLLRE